MSDYNTILPAITLKRKTIGSSANIPDVGANSLVTGGAESKQGLMPENKPEDKIPLLTENAEMSDFSENRTQQQVDTVAECTTKLQLRAELSEVVGYVDKRLKQLPIENDERMALRGIFTEVLHEATDIPVERTNEIKNFLVPEYRASDELLQVTLLEHADALQKSLRGMRQLSPVELYNLVSTRRATNARSTISRIRKLTVDRKAALVRWQALQRSQTAMGTAHVRYYPPKKDRGYSCYFCWQGFDTVIKLHAHLLTQKHICLDLAQGYNKMIRKHITKSRIISQANNSNNGNDNQTLETTHQLVTTKNQNVKSITTQSKHTFGLQQLGPGQNTTLPYLQCMYCGGWLTHIVAERHQCFQEMEEYLTKEIQHMNLHGSPFVCLLCHGRVYDTPAQLQLHLVASHGAHEDLTRCALCEVALCPQAVRSQKSTHLLTVVYHRHLADQHLPSLLLAERLFYMGFAVGCNSVESNAPNDNMPYRAYRCVFLQDLPAGEGPQFPFPHWLRETLGSELGERTPRSESGRLSMGFVHTVDRRPSRLRAYRTALVSPLVIHEQAILSCPKNVSSELTSSCVYCDVGRSGGLGNIAQLTAHVLCVHSGNPFTISGLRQLVHAKHALKKAEERRIPFEQAYNTVEKWVAYTKWRETESMLQAKKEFLKVPSNNNTNTNNSKSVENEDRLGSIRHKSSVADHLGGSSRLSESAIKKVPYESNRTSKIDTQSFLSEPDSQKTTRKQRSINSTNHRGTLTQLDAIHQTILRPRMVKLGKNCQTILKDLRNTLDKAAAEQKNYCRACLCGPMCTVRDLTNHVRDLHYRFLEARLVQLRRSGTFAGLIDPLKTCFQCYTILDDQLAFQVHMVVMHGSRYPLVCGLCNDPLIGLEVGVDFNELCLKIFTEAGVSVASEKWAKACTPDRTWTTRNNTKNTERKSQGAKEFEQFDESVRNVLEIEELRAIRSCVKANLAVLTYSPQLVFRAMEMHESRHRELIRKRYGNEITVHEKVKLETMLDIQQMCIFQGVGQTMTDQYREIFLRNGERHERQIELEPCRFDTEIWKPYTDGIKMLAPTDVMNRKTEKRPSRTVLPEHLKNTLAAFRANQHSDE
ncbi:hypothetical protein PHET_01361 [Paragonimus heterotremus]|uniref:C2H2-type domain-containing protein n=1 Tax=Paragonimus heterotremus TaxID=100268 RepID=A0A8J4SQV4_9TREM|nr:hypothetical protein PHET_01361 [Paragonimus heterotremus]